MNRPVRLCGVLMALVVATTACTSMDRSENDPILVRPGEQPEFGAAAPATLPQQPYSFGAVILCLKDRGSVTIDRIDVVQPTGGIRVKNFAARANPMEYNSDSYGAGNETLSVAGFPLSRPVTIDKKCAGDDKVTDETGSFELGFEFTKADDVTAQTNGLRLQYSSGKKQRTLEIPFTVVLCAASDKETEGCG